MFPSMSNRLHTRPKGEEQMKKKITIALAVVLGTLLASPASAAFSGSGSILVGHPVTGFTGGVAEIAGRCDSQSELNGTDGVWFDISGNENLTAVLTMSEELDADAWFYDANCRFIRDSSMAQLGIGETEVGIVPGGAAYVVVDGFLGSGTFTIDIA